MSVRQMVQRRVHRALLPALALGALAAAGCATGMSNFRDPDVSLQQIVVRGAGLTGGNLDLVLNVYNPNGFTVRGSRLQMAVEVNGKHVGDVDYREDYTVTENDTTRITLPLRFSWAGTGEALRAALNYGDIPYKLNSKATLRIPTAGERSIPFTREGRAPLTRIGLGLNLREPVSIPGN